MDHGDVRTLECEQKDPLVHRRGTNAHPWMAQRIADMDMIRQVDGRDELADILTDNPIAIFTDNDVKEEFINIDFKEITARYLRWNIQEAKQEQVTSGVEHIRGDYECGMLMASGDICTRRFHTEADRRKHIRLDRRTGGEHGADHPLQVVITNMCPWCASAFSSRGAAINHARQALQTGVCTTDRAIAPQPVQDESEFQCRHCEKELQNGMGV